MEFIQHVFYGLIMSYLGLISPGMLNMTTLKIRLNNGRNESLKFAVGASLVVFIQAGIALFFADVFVKNPTIIETLKIIAVIVLFALSLFFFWLSRKKFKSNTTNGSGKFFIKGILMSSINMLAIPFYLGVPVTSY